MSSNVTCKQHETQSNFQRLLLGLRRGSLLRDQQPRQWESQRLNAPWLWRFPGRGIITSTLLSSPQTTRTACRQRRSAGGYWLYTYARVTSTVRNRLAEYNAIRNAVDISGAILSLWDL